MNGEDSVRKKGSSTQERSADTGRKAEAEAEAEAAQPGCVLMSGPPPYD